MLRENSRLRLSSINVFGAVAFTVGFILTAALLPTYFSGLMSPLLMLLPLGLSIAGGILFVVTNSEVQELHRRIQGDVPDSN